MFVVVTGLDGAGKTTLVDSLALDLGTSTQKLHLPHDPEIRDRLQLTGRIDPMEKPWADRQLFAEDNRRASRIVERILAAGLHVVSQRGWMDSFIHGKVVGYDYQTSDSLNRPAELVCPDTSLYMVCDPKEAWKRVRDDPLKDRWENPEYLVKQYEETIAFYERAGTIGNGAFTEPRTLIDTTDMRQEEVAEMAKSWLHSLGLVEIGVLSAI